MKWLCFLLLASASACPTRKETWDVLKKYNHLGKDAIISLCNEKMSWYERLVYPPQWVADKIERDCGLPLTEDAVLHRESCFPCKYRPLIQRLNSP